MKQSGFLRRSGFKNRGSGLKTYNGLKQSAFRTKPVDNEERRLDEAYRAAVLKRDGHKCRICEAIKAGKLPLDRIPAGLEYHYEDIHVHHVKGRSGSNRHDVKQGMSLCVWHHEYSDYAPHHRPLTFKMILSEILQENDNG